MSTHITLRQLEIFLAVGRIGHVTKAAEALHLSQSAASMGVAQLERQLDTSLFEREGRGLKLTERGRLLMAEAQDLMNRVQVLPELLGGTGAAMRGTLRMAASQTIGRYLLAAPVAAFAQAHPFVRIDCRIRNTERVIDALLTHEIDVAYVEGHVADPLLDAQPWQRDELVVVSASTRTAPRRLTPRRFSDLPWLLREAGSGTREFFDHAVRTAGLVPAQALQVLDDTEAIKQAVIAGHGLSCLPKLAIQAELRQHRLVVVGATFLKLERQLWRVTRRDSRSGPLLRAFEQAVERSLSTTDK